MSPSPSPSPATLPAAAAPPAAQGWVIVLLGPTASGKSDLAVALAQHLDLFGSVGGLNSGGVAHAGGAPRKSDTGQDTQRLSAKVEAA